MRRKISSKTTWFHKFAAPTILVVFSAMTLVIAATQNPRITAFSLVVTAIFAMLLCVPLIWFSSKLKHISIDEQFMYIARGDDEEKIPLSRIAEVKQTNWIKPFPVTILLAGSGSKPRKILFIPQMAGLKGARYNPIVAELNQLRSMAV